MNLFKARCGAGVRVDYDPWQKDKVIRCLWGAPVKLFTSGFSHIHCGGEGVGGRVWGGGKDSIHRSVG